MPILDLTNPTPSFFSTQVTTARRFYLNLNPPRSRNLLVLSGGCETCDADYHIRRSDFPWYGIEFVAAGDGQLTLAGREHRLFAGVVFCYGPGVPHEIRNNPDRPLTKYFFDFVGTAAQRLLKTPAPQPGHLVQTSTPQQILPLFDELIRAGLRTTAFRDRICALLAEHLILRIAESAMPLTAAGGLSFETYQRCRTLIEEHYLELQTVEGIAHLARVHAAYLCRLFQRYDHQTPYQYLTRLRMGHAAQRLQSPGTLVKQVADELGYSDPFHFSRTFRRTFGVSPRRFVELQHARA